MNFDLPLVAYLYSVLQALVAYLCSSLHALVAYLYSGLQALVPFWEYIDTRWTVFIEVLSFLLSLIDPNNEGNLFEYNARSFVFSFVGCWLLFQNVFFCQQKTRISEYEHLQFLVLKIIGFGFSTGIFYTRHIDGRNSLKDFVFNMMAVALQGAALFKYVFSRYAMLKVLERAKNQYGTSSTRRKSHRKQQKAPANKNDRERGLNSASDADLSGVCDTEEEMYPSVGRYPSKNFANFKPGEGSSSKQRRHNGA